MSIFDEAWVRAFQYIIADVETDFRWNLIELNPHMGIGIYQASNGESWDLLHNIVTRYPDLKSYFSDEFLKTFDSGSKRWGYKVFTNSQANQIRKCLATTNAKKVQQEMFDSFANRYIKVMKRNHITNKKGSIFASTIYHQTPKRMFQVFNAVGNAPYTRWYTGAMNNAVLRNYPSRYRKVKNFLASWDGKEIKKIPDGVSTKDWDADDIGDIDPDYGSSSNILMIEDMKINKFKAEILEQVLDKKEICKREDYWIRLYNAVESDDFYNLSYPLDYSKRDFQNSIKNEFGELYKEFAANESAISKRINSARKVGFNTLEDFYLDVYQKIKVENNVCL